MANVIYKLFSWASPAEAGAGCYFHQIAVAAYNTGNWAACAAALQNVSGKQSLVETNLATVLGIQNTLRTEGRYDYTTTEKSTLEAIAQSDSRLGGQGVHQARALYNVVTDQNISFTDSCNYTASNARLGKLEDENYETEQAELVDNDVFIYPNPSNGNDVLISVAKTGVDAVDVSINTIDGIAIYKESITLANGIGKLNLKAASGVYMVIITINQSKQRVIKKLVIQK